MPTSTSRSAWAFPDSGGRTRWTSAEGGEGFFVMYELEDHAVLASAPYAARLNAPSPWSTRMMPLHRNMVRSQCQVLQSHGAVTARHALTIRFSPVDGGAESLQRGLGELAASVSMRPGLVGLHVLRHEAPPLAVTTEQKIRGNADRVADWVLVACGYDAAARAAERNWQHRARARDSASARAPRAWEPRTDTPSATTTDWRIPPRPPISADGLEADCCPTASEINLVRKLEKP